MNQKEGLRPVEVNYKGDVKKGFFHRFVFMMYSGQSETKVLVELDNGKLRYFDPYFVQFTDRSKEKQSPIDDHSYESDNKSLE